MFKTNPWWSAVSVWKYSMIGYTFLSVSTLVGSLTNTLTLISFVLFIQHIGRVEEVAGGGERWAGVLGVWRGWGKRRRRGRRYRGEREINALKEMDFDHCPCPSTQPFLCLSLPASFDFMDVQLMNGHGNREKPGWSTCTPLTGFLYVNYQTCNLFVILPVILNVPITAFWSEQ